MNYRQKTPRQRREEMKVYISITILVVQLMLIFWRFTLNLAFGLIGLYLAILNGGPRWEQIACFILGFLLLPAIRRLDKL